ncbi:MAG TPA: biopolymer transporter ExbD [Telmatospirillum sp.]|nr:biopolymer transporter ExbD [Telmatospirillum sp.]
MIPLDPDNDPYGGTPRLLSEINVTPFIDVMLVLLIIFMVAAPLMMVGVPLKLPKTAAQTIHQQQKPVVVSLDKEGHLFVGQDGTGLDQLSEKLAALVKTDPELVVYVRADKELDYGRVMDLLGKVGAGGVARLSLVAEGQALPGEPPAR